MILYYALGGGLGHIARSFALLAHATEEMRRDVRLLVSSSSADVARPHSPCPVDRVPQWAMAGNGRHYSRFLKDYLEHYDFSCMVMDTFPFGLMGELKYMAPEVPRVLIGRYLRWDACIDRCGAVDDALWPRVAIMIERQEEAYMEWMERKCNVIKAEWPISLAGPTKAAAAAGVPACCVVHSGPPSEVARLEAVAKKIMNERGIAGTAKVFTPDSGLFPLERHLSGFSDVVTGAGYASCAAAAVLKGGVRYHLNPFPRRFDDQALRLRRMMDGLWGNDPSGGASTVAEVLWKNVSALLK